MTLFSLLSDDAAIFLRWVHVVAAMVWVGSAFALVRLDLAMRPRGGDQRPQSLLLNAGAGFRFFRAENADATETPVHFKWEAYAAWASGFALLCLIFCAAPRPLSDRPRRLGRAGLGGRDGGDRLAAAHLACL